MNLEETIKCANDIATKKYIAAIRCHANLDDEAFRWSWVNVRDCTPYKKKKHKKKGCKQY